MTNSGDIAQYVKNQQSIGPQGGHLGIIQGLYMFKLAVKWYSNTVTTMKMIKVIGKDLFGITSKKNVENGLVWRPSWIHQKVKYVKYDLTMIN